MKIFVLLVIFFSFMLNPNAINIESLKEKFKTKEQVSIYLDTNKDDLTIKSEVLDIIKNKNKSLTFDILKDNVVIYSYTFDGSKFSDSYNDINLEISFNTPKNINNIIDDDKLIYFENRYKGYFPNGTQLKIKNLNNYDSDTTLKLYSISNDNFNIIGNNIKLKESYYKFTIEKGNTYILSNKTTKLNINIFITIIVSIIILIELIIIYIIIKKNKNVELSKLKK